MRYDYICSECKYIWEVEKSIKDDDPKVCPKCTSNEVGRYFNPNDIPFILYANRPPWTYKDCLKYKDCKHNGGPRTEIDPSKHGDLGAWHCPGKVIPEKKIKR